MTDEQLDGRLLEEITPANRIVRLLQLEAAGLVTEHQVHERLPFKFDCGCK